MKKHLIKILFQLLLPDRMMPEVTLRKRFTIMNRIRKDEEILNLLRSEYTREYKTVISSWFLRSGKSKEFIEGFYAGRLFKLNELINDITNSENKLQDLESIEGRNKAFGLVDKIRKKSNLIKEPH